MPHIHDKIDFTVEVFVVHGERVLLRSHDKYKIWLGIGGHIEPDEDPNEAAIREVREEAGLEVVLVGDCPPFADSRYKELVPPRFLNRHRISETHEHVTLTYIGRTDSGETSQGETEVSEELRWFTMDELDDPRYELRPEVRHYAKAALQTVGSQR